MMRSLSIAINALKKNMLRSFLTFFGIMIGIAMVILVLSAGNGMKALILGQVASFGNNWISIEVKVPSAGKNSTENSSAVARGVTITTLTYADAKSLLQINNVADAYGALITQAVASNQNEKIRAMVYGVSAGYARIDTHTMSEGDFFTEEDDQSAANVVVLGSEIKDKLFGNDSPLGKSVSINGKTFRVVGVRSSIGATGFFNMDTLIYIPLKTVQKKMMGVGHVATILAQVKDPKQSEATAEEMRSILRERHQIVDASKDDFAVTTQDEAIATVNTILFGITVLLVTLAAISLLVGGVGIMNVMYVSVAERTFEIGLRKAVGATSKNILQQFLTEAVLLTVIGAVLGIFIGIFFSYLISVIAQSQGLSWPFSVSLFSVVLSAGFACGVGILFGVQPARRAVELSPIEAILKE